MCHENCLNGCSGPENSLGPNGCDQCKIAKDGSFCVKECPNTKYNNNGTCKGNLIYKVVIKNIMFQNNYFLKLIAPFYYNFIGLGKSKNHITN